MRRRMRTWVLVVRLAAAIWLTDVIVSVLATPEVFKSLADLITVVVANAILGVWAYGLKAIALALVATLAFRLGVPSAVIAISAGVVQVVLHSFFSFVLQTPPGDQSEMLWIVVIGLVTSAAVWAVLRSAQNSGTPASPAQGRRQPAS